MFTHSYSENSHEHANENSMFYNIVQSSAGDKMIWQWVHRYGVVLVARSTLMAQRLQSCMDHNGLSSCYIGQLNTYQYHTSVHKAVHNYVPQNSSTWVALSKL